MALVDVNIKVPMEMAVYLEPSSQVTELERNALLLYPYILKQVISLIDIYDKLGFSYLDLIMDDLDMELKAYRKLKAKEDMV